ncbi:MAG: FeoA family protein [Clostridia bacterium]
MLKIKTLNDLEVEDVGIVKKIDGDEMIKRRLLDLGLIEGTKIKPVLVSPSGDPKAFEFRGALIAIREEDTINIKIK